MTPETVSATDAPLQKFTTALSYVLVALLLVIGWQFAESNMIRAQDGVGYWLGIIGASLMGLLLLYPARKRFKPFRHLGPVKYWFQVHMIFGIVGPLLIIFHSNFNLGSTNSQIALFCTLIVAGSGIIGRYLYAKLHYGLYGKSADLISLRGDIEDLRDSNTSLTKLIPTINETMNAWEDAELNRLGGFPSAVLQALRIGLLSRWRYYRMRRQARQLIHEAANASAVLASHEKRLYQNTCRYLLRRVTFLRKFAQYRVMERLFSLWHIIHYPLFLLLVLSVIIHIVAVHMY